MPLFRSVECAFAKAGAAASAHPDTPAPRLPETALSAAAQRRFQQREGVPLFRADWLDVVFIHFAVQAGDLQPLIPFALDLHEGHAWVSLVAFTMDRMRLGPLPHWLCRWLLQPLSPCRFLNVRTYVRHAEEPGIFFMAEWISNRLAVPLGPVSFGLPYRPGRLYYGRTAAQGLRGRVTSKTGGALLFTGATAQGATYGPVPENSREEFLLERYTAYTEHRGCRRLFRIWHEPWAQTGLELDLQCASLLPETGPWCRNAQLVGAQYSPGVRQVSMGRPRRVRA